MCCEVSHTIELINLENNSVVNHELILIKGLIRKTCSHNQVHLRNSIETQWCTDPVPVVNNEFKILYHLKAETDEILISYCTAHIKFNCRYVPAENPYKIQPLYIVCKGHDGSFNASTTQSGTAEEACAIIDLNIKLLQCLYAEKLNECGFGRKTFSLKAECQIFESDLDVEEIWSCTQEELWNKFAYEVINSSFGSDSRVKFIAFIGCTKYEPITDGDFTYENIRKHLKGHAALGGGGLALFGSAYFYSWPSKFEDIRRCFENNETVDLEKFADDSNYRRTYAGVYATSLGAVCHEIGHIFDLGHTNDGIMGNGFDYVNGVFTVNRLTESLPDRVIEKKADPNPRLTKIKRDRNGFLEKYHEQRNGGDSFYFTRNCAVILAYHRWLRGDSEELKDSEIRFDKKALLVLSSAPLKLIEVRCPSNSLVLEFFEIPDGNSVYEFKLPTKWTMKRNYVFVICTNGMTKRLELDE